MKFAVDWDKCSGIGICEALAPDLFEVNVDGKLELLQGTELPDDRIAEIESAISGCPTSALSKRI